MTRQSVTLPDTIAEHVRRLAVAKRLSANQVIVELVEAGLESRNREKERFMALAEELANCKNRRRQSEIKRELARLTFGE
jgi:hypothetical protein